MLSVASLSTSWVESMLGCRSVALLTVLQKKCEQQCHCRVGELRKRSRGSAAVWICSLFYCGSVRSNVIAE
jgi:hypothetical protein